MAPRRILLVHGKAEACFRFGLSHASMRFGIGRTAKVKSCFCFRFNANGPGGAPFRPAQKLRCSRRSQFTPVPGKARPNPSASPLARTGPLQQHRDCFDAGAVNSSQDRLRLLICNGVIQIKSRALASLTSTPYGWMMTLLLVFQAGASPGQHQGLVARDRIDQEKAWHDLPGPEKARTNQANAGDLVYSCGALDGSVSLIEWSAIKAARRGPGMRRSAGPSALRGFFLSKCVLA